MIKKRVYIFFTYSIVSVGGSSMYTAGKAKYLEDLGWEVYAFGSEKKAEKSKIPVLTKYVEKGTGYTFLSMPPYKFDNEERERGIKHILEGLKGLNFKNCDIIVESHADKLSYWAELLAERIGARHFFCALNESYRPSFADLSRTYGENLDFFYFKWQRNEIICRPTTCRALFNGYKDVIEPKYDVPNTVHEMHPIQDVEDFPIERIEKLDWNILHIGRPEKTYVPAVIEGVATLAKHYPDKSINFIMVGKYAYIIDLIRETFDNIDNVSVTFCDVLVPIPRILFSKVDVVCAISQTALFCADEGVLTICGSIDSPYKTPGVLGYDTGSSTFNEPAFSYSEALENVLVKKLYADKKYTLPKILPEEHHYKNFWKIVEVADPEKKYFTANFKKVRIRKWLALFPFSSVARGARVILFGATKIAEDYRYQVLVSGGNTEEYGRDYVKKLKREPYCEIVATVDEHPENFDDSVQGYERLKTIDYDVIVVAWTSDRRQYVQDIIDEVVPGMRDRVVWGLRTIQTVRLT